MDLEDGGDFPALERRLRRQKKMQQSVTDLSVFVKAKPLLFVL